jgi:hypothetical protein
MRIRPHRRKLNANARTLFAIGGRAGYDSRMAEAVYAIDDFPDDDLLWRIEWFGGVGYNTSVPSDPLIDVCLTQLPPGETNPLSARSRSSQTKRTVKISVGLLPYISIASVWQQQRPVVTDLAACRHQLRVNTSSSRMVALGDVATNANAIPRRSYLFGASWPYVRRTLLVAIEQDGDPYAVMVPTAEIMRFYYTPSTRLAQALFWGEYNEAFDAGRSGVFEGGVVKIHLRRWLEDQDAWTLARYLCSPVMQREAGRLYRGLRLDQLNSASLISEPDQALRCGFPFEGPTTVRGIFLSLQGPTRDSPPRWLILRIERCSAPFPFDRVIVDRDNNSMPGENAGDENLIPAWAKCENKLEREVKTPAPDVFQSNQEPGRGLDPLKIDVIEDRFEYLSGKKLVKEEKVVQRYRFSPMTVAANQILTGLGTGQGTWGPSNLQLAKLTTVQSQVQKRRDVPVLPASMETFVQAIELLAQERPCEVGLIGVGEADAAFGAHTLASFPTHDPRKDRIAWAWIRKENRPRRVAIAEIRSGDKIAYALEIERTNQEHAILVLARIDLQKIDPVEWRAFLLMCARRRGWVSEDEVPGYQRKTTTHRELVGISVLESRIWRKIEEMFKSAAIP